MLFNQPIWKLILEFYIIFVMAYFVVRFVTSSKRVLAISMVFGSIYGLNLDATTFDFEVLNMIFQYIMPYLPVMYIVIMASDIRRSLDVSWKSMSKQDGFVMGNQQTKTQIVDAVVSLAQQKTGALITIEKHNTLEQYAERAVMLNSRVTKELLINIFTPLTPLHDGAVIIRGDQILCAGAYYVLSDNENVESSTGSRHRAGLGISEVTDSMTIIVSEETGNISIAIEGILLKNNDREKLLEYLNTFMK